MHKGTFLILICCAGLVAGGRAVAEMVPDMFRFPDNVTRDVPLGLKGSPWVMMGIPQHAGVDTDFWSPDLAVMPHASFLCDICEIDVTYAGCVPLPDRCAQEERWE